MTVHTTINYPLEYSLRLFGLWPETSYPIIKTIVWTIIMLTFLVFQCWYCITHITSSLVDLLDGFCITLSNSLLFLKLVIIWLHHRTFRDILTVVFEDCNKYDSTIEDKRLMADKATLSSRISNVLMVYYAMTFLAYSGFALVSFHEDVDISASKERKLLIRMAFPFDATITPVYEIILVLQFIFESLMAYGAATSLALITALILHVGSQIDIFCKKLTELSCNYEKKELPKLILKDIVINHQRIIRLSKNIENIFTYISLYQFLSNMLVICFSSFILVIVSKLNSLRTEQTAEIIIKCFPYYLGVNCEAFILCYTGEYLASKSEGISESVYSFLWYELEPQDARDILLVILQSQTQLILTAGKFVSLSLEAFANMLKASASYVSVLYAMY